MITFAELPKCVSVYMNGKILSSMAALIFAATVSASAQPGIEAGYLNTQYRNRYIASDELLSKSSMNGFFVGASDDIKFFAGLGLHTGLYYNYSKDATNTDAGGLFSMSGTREDHELSIPVHLKFSFDVVPEVKIFVYGGPSLYFGLVSDVKYSLKDASGNSMGYVSYNYYSGKVRTGNMDESAESSVGQYLPSERHDWFNVTMDAGIGVQFIDLFEIRFGYGWGLVNLYKNDYESELYCRKNVLQLSAGFRF